jgi:hypothetical protein
LYSRPQTRTFRNKTVRAKASADNSRRSNTTRGGTTADLTGSLCDAYLLMSEPVAADGSSSGDIYAFGMRGGHDLAKYRATVK